MPLKTQTVEEPRLNLTPMIDIVFLLIIFFMVGSEFTKRQAEADVLLNVKLPTVDDIPALSRAPDPILIAVPIQGKMAVKGGPQNERGRAVDLGELRRFLAEAKRIDEGRDFHKRAVIIRPDGQGAVQRTYDAVHAANKAGFQSVQVAARPTTETNESTQPTARQ